MPTTKSAMKAMRQSIKRRVRNTKVKETYKGAVKDLKKLITAAKKTETAEALKKAMSALDKAVKKNVIHKNKASRLKSRLMKAIAKLK
jgi:small subunit ribosomal protein S20